MAWKYRDSPSTPSRFDGGVGGTTKPDIDEGTNWNGQAPTGNATTQTITIPVPGTEPDYVTRKPEFDTV
jgi:hypothetical protein